MSQLTDFIPRTTAECRALLKELNDNRDGIAIADRYGRIDALNATEIKALTGLIENQIGGKAPEEAHKEEKAPVAEPKRDAQRPVTRPSNKKPAKK